VFLASGRVEKPFTSFSVIIPRSVALSSCKFKSVLRIGVVSGEHAPPDFWHIQSFCIFRGDFENKIVLFS